MCGGDTFLFYETMRRKCDGTSPQGRHNSMIYRAEAINVLNRFVGNFPISSAEYFGAPPPPKARGSRRPGLGCGRESGPNIGLWTFDGCRLQVFSLGVRVRVEGIQREAKRGASPGCETYLARVPESGRRFHQGGVSKMKESGCFKCTQNSARSSDSTFSFLPPPPPSPSMKPIYLQPGQDLAGRIH